MEQIASASPGRSSAGLPTARDDLLHRRVVISGATLGLGGIRTHLLLLCQVLRRRGIEVSLFATGSHWDESSMSRIREIGVQLTLPPTPLRQTRRLAALYSSLTWPLKMPRTANSLYCIGAGHSHLLLHRLRPNGTSSINHEIVEPPGPDSLAGQCAAKLDFTVANSRKVARLMEGYWPNKPIQVIPFLTSDRPTPVPLPRCPVGSGTLRVVFLGRLVEQKRPDLLVRSWSRLAMHPALAKARLDIHGHDPDGRMLSELRSQVATSGQSDSIKIHGEYRLADLPRILGEADLIVLPSLWEGLPLVLVEAMLKGVPFVATAAGGTEELGENNPDVMVTGTAWNDFEAGLVTMSERLRSKGVQSARLHAWVEDRYGYTSVSRRWLDCLSRPIAFFNPHD